MKAAPVALALLSVAGCAFRVEGVDLDLGPDVDLQLVEVADLSGTGDLRPDQADGATPCDPGGADDQCSADQQSILRCLPDGSGYASTSCDYGCVATGGVPHCARLEPSGVAQASDCETATAMPTITSNLLFNTDDGSISGGLTRAPGEGVKNGISFRVATQATGPNVGVFGFAGLTLAQGIVVHARGAAALSIVSSGDVVINGTVDLQDACTATTLSAGAGAGGSADTSGSGSGGGGAGGTDAGGKSSGAGGGGHGDVGGGGGATMLAGGRAGSAFGDLTVEPLTLEGGGGGGGAGGAGGNGGGAFQVAVNGTLTVKGTIHAGGCGGGGGGASGSGGGGGAGGAILLEAAHVVLVGGSVLAANGGGGGGGGSGATAGGKATAGIGVASGGSGAAQGGSGGAVGSTAGKTPSPGTKLAGGGGGAVGRIVIKTRDGNVDDQGSIWSPRLADVNAGGASPASLGSAIFQ